MTTSSPSLARKIYAAGKKRGLGVLDAPVTGGDRGAREATLTIFAGGDEADFKAAMPYFEKMGRTIKHMGGAGDGQNAKLGNQIVIAGTMTGMCEAMAFAKSCGLDLKEFIERSAAAPPRRGALPTTARASSRATSSPASSSSTTSRT